MDVKRVKHAEVNNELPQCESLGGSAQRQRRNEARWLCSSSLAMLTIKAVSRKQAL